MNLYTISIRTFAKRGIFRGRRRKLRWSKPGLPRGDKPRIDTSKTRTLTATPWGPPRYPIPRVQQTSVEFAQNLYSLSHIVQSKLQCLGIAPATLSHATKAALERLNNYAIEISQSTPYLHLYQLIIVDDILGYSRDIGSRNTLWIPNDFTVKELMQYLKEECINDPKLCEIRRLDNYLNPFQPNNWNSIDHLSQLDGVLNTSQSRINPVPLSEYREVEPVELLKIREKARNTTWSKEQYIDTSDYFNYWHVPNKGKMDKAQGVSDTVPEYIIGEKSTDEQIESKSYLQQIDSTEEELNKRLLLRKEWYLDELERYKQKVVDEEEMNKVNSLLTEEMDSEANHSMFHEINRFRNDVDVGQHLTIDTSATNEGKQQNDRQGEENLCAIHFTSPKKRK